MQYSHWKRFVEKHCTTLTENIPRKIDDSYYLFDIFEILNATGIPDNAILMPFDTVSTFPSIDNSRGVAAVKSALDSRTNLSPSTECIIKAPEICLANNNSLLLVHILYKQMEQQWGQLIVVLTQIWQFKQ